MRLDEASIRPSLLSALALGLLAGCGDELAPPSSPTPIAPPSLADGGEALGASEADAGVALEPPAPWDAGELDDDELPPPKTPPLDGGPPFYRDHANLMMWIDATGEHHDIVSAADWKRRRNHIIESVELVMGPLPRPEPDLPLDMRVFEQTDLGEYTRMRISFVADSGDRVPAWLLIPNDLPGPVPALLALHQTTDPWSVGKDEPAGVETDGADPGMAYAAELTSAHGFVTLAPDYPGFGEYDVDPYALGYASGTMKGIRNHLRAVDLLRSLPQVDPSRIGVIGHSLGGLNAIFVAAFDERIRVIVSSCGFTTFEKYRRGDLAAWAAPVFMPRIHTRYDDEAAAMPFDFTEVIGTLAPRAFFANSPTSDAVFDYSGVDDAFAAASPVYRLFQGARQLTRYHPPGGHGFSEDARAMAYEFIDATLW
jgi:dienelactone hydrolase